MKVRTMIFTALMVWVSAVSAAPPEIHLSGTMQSQSEQIAYIEGKVYHLNDEIMGYFITEINERGITIKNEDGSEIFFVETGSSPKVSKVEQPDVPVPTVTTVSPAEAPAPEAIEVIYAESTQDGSSAVDGIKMVLALILIFIGFLLALIGNIWFLVAAFRESIGWGLGCLLFSPVQLFFLIFHWQEASKPWGLSLLGVAIAFGAMFITPAMFQSYGM